MDFDDPYHIEMFDLEHSVDENRRDHFFSGNGT